MFFQAVSTSITAYENQDKVISFSCTDIDGEIVNSVGVTGISEGYIFLVST